MDKPISLSVKNYLIRKLAVKMMVSESVIDAVVTHQFHSALEALSTHDSLELSGFGKFYFNKKKALKKMEKMLSQKAVFENILKRPELTEQKRASTEVKLKNVLYNIEYLKPRIQNGTV
jgi:nucleoid DNA-binding protein